MLDHLLDEAVDKLLAVTEVTALGEVVGLLAPASAGVVQLEVPDEVVGDLEVRSDGVNLVDQVLDADNAELAEPLLDDVVREGTSTTLEFSESPLVDKFTNGFEVGISPGDVRVGDAQHAQRRLVQLHEGSVVDLTQAEKLEYLFDSWVESVDTSDSHDNGQLGFGWDVEVAMLAGVSGKAKLLGVGRLVLLGVSLGLLEDRNALSLGSFLFEESILELFGAKFCVGLPLLEERLGNSGNRVSRHF